MALAMGLAFAPVAEAVASVEGVNIVAPAKKRRVKKTAKKATKRKAVLSKTTASTTETATTVAPVKVDSSKRSKTSTPSESSGSGLLGGIMSAIGGGAESGSILWTLYNLRCCKRSNEGPHHWHLDLCRAGCGVHQQKRAE